MRRLAAGLICGWLALAVGAPEAAPASFERFFGEYEGEAISEGDGEVTKRDLRVTIAPYENGFNVTWVAITQRPDGTLKRKEYSINFSPSSRENIFRSAMRKDLFGQAVPLDPLEGDPYVWARIEGDTLSVHALLIAETGGYELQAYNRTLIEGGLRLEYSRVRDGKVLRTVTGVLTRR
jgi:hypothetical protein